MLTPSQQQALRLERHLCVTANAGSGKTLVLVERYLDIVGKGDVSVGEVVAITFTDKAASELKRKIAQGVADRLQRADDAATRITLERVREQLPTAVIHTIHGFCSRILREYPVEAGVDASFTVVEPIDQETLLLESFQDVYRAVLRENTDPALKEQLLSVLRRIGKQGVRHMVETLGHKRELAERLAGEGGLYDRTDDDLILLWQQELTGRLRLAMDDPVLCSDLLSVVNVAKGKSGDDMRAELGRFQLSTDPAERARSLSQIFGTILTRKGEVSKTFLGRNVDLPDHALLAERARRLDPLLALATKPECGAMHRDLLRSTRPLLAIYRLAVLRYNEKKAAAGQLDFDDLQFMTRDLLKKEFVRNRLATRFRYIMVDEYQDTNLLQYEILKPLVGDLRSGNLFIVGDPKQSIYGFRNADVAVFDRTKRDIHGAAGNDADVVLGESFRPLGDVAAFVNAVFGRTMGRPHAGATGFEIPYNEMIVARENESRGRVEVMLLSDDSGAMSEGEAVARRIRQLYGTGFQVFDRAEHPRTLGFRDIAILLRSRKNLGEFEAALVQHRIPYVVSGGAGYFQTQTIYDFYNYFRFVINRHNDVALTGILRSPFFSVSDAELFQAAGETRTGSLWDHLRSGRNQWAFPSLTRALDILAEDLNSGLRMTAPELLDRIVERTAIEAVSEAVPRGDQGIANLRKLEKIARTYDSRGFTTLYDFTARLKRLVEEEEKEGQAVIDVQRDAVQIMTVHAAKGLEFPLVIVPTLERRFQPEQQPYLDQDLGIGFSHDGGEEKAPTPLTEVLRQQARARAIEEEKRIFYVACTRARDCLILSTGDAAGGSSTSWLHWLREALPLETAGEDKTFTVPSALKVLQRTGDDQAISEINRPLTVHLVRTKDLADLPVFGSPSIVAGPPIRIAVEPVVRLPRGEIFSASKIRTYLECPSLYYLKYVLGLPEEDGGRTEGERRENEDDQPIEPGKKGTIIHGALEKIGERGIDAARPLVEELASAAGGMSERDLEELTRTVKAVVCSDSWNRMMKGTESRTEFSLTGALDSDYITGTIDRLFCDLDGIWHVVDYKTDQISEAEIDRRFVRYLPQLKLYALLVSRLHNADPVRVTLLFTSCVDSPRTALLSATELAGFESELRKVISSINSMDFKPLQCPCPGCPLPQDGCSHLFP